MISAGRRVAFLLAVFFPCLVFAEVIPNLQPGSVAPAFVLQTTRKLLKYGNGSESIEGPIVFLAYTTRSGFMERLLSKPDSFKQLMDNSPDNVHYVFLFFDENPASICNTGVQALANSLQERFMGDMYSYQISKERKSGDHLARFRRFLNHRQNGEPLLKNFTTNWSSRIHFATFPVSSLGNWIPRVLSQWYCSGHGCGFDQIVVENMKSEILCIIKRLDARYDWLPSPDTLAQYGHLPVVFVGDACNDSMSAINLTGRLALVSMEGEPCSYFTKVQNCERNGAMGVVVINLPSRPLIDMNCFGWECDFPLGIPATMIPFQEGYLLNNNNNSYVRFQTTPSDTFAFGIDGQGKVQETGWFLYPSMLFLAYQAQWFNYKTQLLQNLTSSEAKVVNIFNQTVMKGEYGVVARVNLPSFSELQRYEHVELELYLSCPGTRDDTCAHWDHVVQLFVCCNSASELCGMELGRWITPFRRRIGHWITPVKPLIPLLSSASPNVTNQCNFTMKTVPWAMAWVPTLNIRLVSKVHVLKQYNTWNAMEKSLVPFQLVPLFRGGTFDRNYNKKYKPIRFSPPSDTERVKLVATITGHGSDNNNCAEFCVTSHHFVVNNKHNYTRVFKNAGKAMGCAERVPEGVVPNEHGTWLYGRDGWCDGQELVPWVVDITQVLKLDESNNTITYYGWFNNTDPNPSRNPGKIIMYSFLAYYKYLTP